VSKELAVLLTVGAGGLVAAQAPANNVISGQVGDFGAALVSFLVGTVLILVLTFTVAGGIHGDEGAQAPAWYYWILGGVGGAAIVVVTLVTVRELGAGGATAAVIAGSWPSRWCSTARGSSASTSERSHGTSCSVSRCSSPGPC
jgi:transporter family-2 protein